MGNVRFEDITSDYYSDNSSYVKTVLDHLPECMITEGKKDFIDRVVNEMVKKMSEQERIQYRRISRKFNDILALSSEDNIMVYVTYIYKVHLEKLFASTIEKRKYCFEKMNGCIVRDFIDCYESEIHNIRGYIPSMGRHR